MIGLFTTGNSGFGWFAVMGRSRVPSPPAITTALTAGSPRTREIGWRSGRLVHPLHVGDRSIVSSAVTPRPPGLYDVQDASPPVQSRSPHGEGPTDHARHCRARAAPVAEQQQRERVEH